jgi:hypothetical protein
MACLARYCKKIPPGLTGLKPSGLKPSLTGCNRCPSIPFTYRGTHQGEQMSEWVYIQAEPGEQLMQLHSFSFIKKQATGDVQFSITVKEFAVPPPGQRVRFFAEADKQVNQKCGAFVPCGWGTTLFSALGDCVRLIRQFPYDQEGSSAA